MERCVIPMLSEISSGTEIKLGSVPNLEVIRVTFLASVRVPNKVFKILLILATLHNKVPCDML